MYAPTLTAVTVGEANQGSELARFLIHHNPITTPLRDIVAKCRILESQSSSKNLKDSQEKLPSWIQWYNHALNEAPSKLTDGEQGVEANKGGEPTSGSFRALLPEYPARPLRRPQPNLGIFASSVASKPDMLRPYHLIDPVDPLQISLCNKSFLEFPTFVFVPASNEAANDAVILVEDIPEDGVILHGRKRRRLDQPGSSSLHPPPKRMGAMLSGYSSDEEAKKTKSNTPLGLLDGYDSDGSDPPAVDEENGVDGKDAVDSPSGSLITPGFTETPLASRWLPEYGDDEAVDWGEDDAD